MAAAAVHQQPPAGQLLSFNPARKYSDMERWYCIYPAYLNSKKTKQEGRRLTKENCVPDPTFQEIRDVLQAAGLRVLSEEKIYCREKIRDMAHFGRVRVQLRDENGQVLDPNFPSKRAVLAYLGETIPKLKSRVSGKQGSSSSVTASTAAGSGAMGGNATSGGEGGKKKKGKR